MRALFLALVLLLMPGLALGADKAKARDLYRVGTQHYNLAEYDKALDAFKEAYRNYEDPIFLFNIGQCHRQLDHKQDAIVFYRAYLRNAPNAPNRGEVNALITKLEAAIADESAVKRMPPPSPAPPVETAPKPAPAAVPPAAMPPPTAATEPSPTTTQAVVARAPEKTPVYKKWWLWTIVGVVVAGAAVGTAVAVTQTPSAPTTPTELGNYRF